MRPLVVVVALATAGCAMHSIPKDRAIEATFLPTAGGLTLASAPEVRELPDSFKVVTFNVHMEPADKIAPAIAGDRAIADADILILQEVHRTGEDSSVSACSGACDIGKRLGYHAIYAPSFARAGGDDGVAILSRAPITSAQIIPLPYFHTHFNGGRRVALVATIQHAGKPVTVYAVHLENRLSVKQRRRQMLPILAHAKEQPTPVVIAGDFNTSPFTWVNHVVPVPTGTQARRFERLMRANGFDTPVTDSGATFRYIGMRLDAIYTRGFETTKFAVAKAADVSDHLPLWATLVARPAPSQLAALPPAARASRATKVAAPTRHVPLPARGLPARRSIAATPTPR
jgi:endonuclease/exonuclease/phosphatase family metal-dependent hydrolase